MKKTCGVALVLVLALSASAFAIETTLVKRRAEFLEESKSLKSLLPKTKDVLLVNNMWNSCIITVHQLDGYFSMVGIFNTIKTSDITDESLQYLMGWLGEIKIANELNVKNLNIVTQEIEPATAAHLRRLKERYAELNSQIELDLAKLMKLKKALRK